MKIRLHELRNVIRVGLTEAPIPVREPVTPEQKLSMIELIKWASGKMQVPTEIIQAAVAKATEHDDWSEVTDLLRDFYILKGMKFQTA